MIAIIKFITFIVGIFFLGILTLFDIVFIDHYIKFRDKTSLYCSTVTSIIIIMLLGLLISLVIT